MPETKRLMLVLSMLVCSVSAYYNIFHFIHKLVNRKIFVAIFFVYVFRFSSPFFRTLTQKSAVILANLQFTTVFAIWYFRFVHSWCQYKYGSALLWAIWIWISSVKWYITANKYIYNFNKLFQFDVFVAHIYIPLFNVL